MRNSYVIHTGSGSSIKQYIVYKTVHFFPTIIFARISARSWFDFRHSQRNRGGWFPSVISNAYIRAYICAYREGYLGGNLERSYNKPLLGSFLLSRICGHRVRKSSSAIFCNSYSTRSRAPRIESHRLGKSSSVIFYNVCTLRSRACPGPSRCVPKGLEWRYYAG